MPVPPAKRVGDEEHLVVPKRVNAASVVGANHVGETAQMLDSARLIDEPHVRHVKTWEDGGSKRHEKPLQGLCEAAGEAGLAGAFQDPSDYGV